MQPFYGPKEDTSSLWFNVYLRTNVHSTPDRPFAVRFSSVQIQNVFSDKFLLSCRLLLTIFIFGFYPPIKIPCPSIPVGCSTRYKANRWIRETTHFSHRKPGVNKPS